MAKWDETEMGRWQSGYARDCRSRQLGFESRPALYLKIINFSYKNSGVSSTQKKPEFWNPKGFIKAFRWDSIPEYRAAPLWVKNPIGFWR